MAVFDSHCHYNLEPLLSDWQHYWREAQEAGVSGCVNVGTTVETSGIALHQASQTENMWCSVGLHPHEAQEHLDLDIESEIAELEKLLKSDTNKKVVAIGEIGLDYYRLPKNKTEKRAIRENQRNLCSAQLQLALKHNLPIILHIRDHIISDEQIENNAYWDMWRLLEAEYLNEKHAGFILHCASGPKSFVQKCIDAGAYVSFAGNVTYPNAEHLRNLLTMVPEDKILVETDAPYLAPQKFRGQMCEPRFVVETANLVGKETSKFFN